MLDLGPQELAMSNDSNSNSNSYSNSNSSSNNNNNRLGDTLGVDPVTPQEHFSGQARRASERDIYIYIYIYIYT